jgi:type I restriction enzyme R subunit
MATRNFAASIHARLLNGAQERREDFNLTLQRYAAERFLYRLGASRHREQFVLKGAMLFPLWGGSLYRATRDLDLTGYAKDDARTLVAIMQEICAVSCLGDGLVFQAATLRAEPIRDRNEYHGFRVKLEVLLGSARINLQIDVGFGNAIEPPAQDEEYPVLLNGQDVQDAIRQYMTDRDPREPLLAYGRCLAHFAVDPDLVYVTTQLAGARTRFLPFNQGKFRGAGNPPVSPTRSGYPTSYLWEETWARHSVLDLVRQFIHEIEEEDDRGHKTGKRFLIFPRYQQLDAVRKLVAQARSTGAGRRYLIQHSAGSGKSYTIAWLAHQLATLHDSNDRRVFDSIVVITDRRILDRQLQTNMRQFEQTLGVVENIDKTSHQLKEALEAGKTIIVTTLQKFPKVAKDIRALPAKRFAVIVDEAHSSQSGERSTQPIKDVLRVDSLEDAEENDAHGPDDEDRLNEVAAAHRWPANTSLFAFTATPKPKTLELFGTRRADGKFEPFHLYTMRQAIEEGFILDVLANYTTYTAYWRLLKTIEADPRYDKKKAQYLLKSFVELHRHAIGEKLRIMVEHFAAQVQGEIGGKAKAMIVTRSRLHAVRYRLAVDRYLSDHGYPFKALVAFSGKVEDGGKSYTEAGMNGFPETQTARTFEHPENRFLIVANKFQTGFDQPLLHTMCVDKKLGGRQCRADPVAAQPYVPSGEEGHHRARLRQ